MSPGPDLKPKLGGSPLTVPLNAVGSLAEIDRETSAARPAPNAAPCPKRRRGHLGPSDPDLDANTHRTETLNLAHSLFAMWLQLTRKRDPSDTKKGKTGKEKGEREENCVSGACTCGGGLGEADWKGLQRKTSQM
ncbi:hypothetical protein SKAU_G00375200 [Synaphobranchus kaupii]|uniref:Uncharacterized protein n=1 Tax=Synaphobranchus kaupii TaxID=118154 RepID=A0A9Q1EGU2_SYNKA|nr:hypothetical protein SKAU_G00375200 [Synaphobranchus kaupii]